MQIKQLCRATTTLLLFCMICTHTARLKEETEPLRRRRLARAWGHAASQARLMEHMAGKKRRRETENGGRV